LFVAAYCLITGVGFITGALKDFKRNRFAGGIMENEHTNMTGENLKNAHEAQMNNHYSRFLLMIISMFITMYVLMYVVVGGHSNVNQFQMTVLMTAPMVVIEIILMNELYRNRRLNRTIIILSLVFTIGCWLLIREQTTIVEILFRNSEATPHSLTSHESGETNPEIEKLCGETVRAQAQEIQQLKDTLNRIENSH